MGYFKEHHLNDSSRMKINKSVICFILILLASLYNAASAQQIITDGNTATTLNTNATVTDVSTTTITGVNAFNSFTRFNVDAGNTVNLMVPDAASNLVNLVHSEQSNINGTLNSIKSGVVGGNVFIANPYGMVVGANGVINVGSLTAVTPTVEFMNGFFTAPGTPDAGFVTNLLNGTTPINENGVISIAGQINAIENVTLDSGAITNTGAIYTDANFAIDIQTGDLMNLNSLEYVIDNDQKNLVLENGTIKYIAENNIVHDGNCFGKTIEAVSAKESITTNADSIMTAGTNIDLSATKNVTINGDLRSFNLNHQYNLLVNADNTIDASSNVTATIASGTVTVENLNAKTTTGINITGTVLGSGSLTSHNSYANIDITNNSNNFLKLSHINTKLTNKIKTNGIERVADFDLISVNFDTALTQSTDININNNAATNTILSGSITNDTGDVNITGNGIIQTLYTNNITTSNDINITSNINNINNYGVLLNEYYDLTAGRDITIRAPLSKGIELYRRTDTTAGRNISLVGNELIIASSLSAGNDITINPSEKLEVAYTDIIAGNKLTINGGNIDSNGLMFAVFNLEAASLESDFMAQNAPLNITSDFSSITIGNFDNFIIGGNPLNPTSITLVSQDDLNLIDDVTTPGDINLTSNTGYTSIDVLANINAGGDINMFSPGEYCYIGNSSNIIAGNDFNINATGNRYSRLGSRANITTTRDININSTQEAFKLFSDAELNAGRNLTIESADSMYNDGKLTATNNININSEMVKFTIDSITSAVNDLNIITDEIEIDTAGGTPTITANNAVFSRKTAGNFYIGDHGMMLNSTEIPVIDATTLVIGNHANTNSLTNNIYISKDLTAHDGTNVTLSADQSILGGRATVTSTGNISLIATNGQIGNPNHYINVNEGDAGTLNATAANGIHLNETDGDMRLDAITSNNNADIYLSANNGGVIDATNSEQTNITGGNLFIKKQVDAPEYFFIGINGDATENSSSGFISYFLDVLKDKGENWSKMPDSNYVIFDDSVASFTKEDILGTLEFFASMTEDNDMLTIVYNGHGGGGNPAPEFGEPGNYNGYDDGVIDEFNGPDPLNSADEYLYLQDFPIFDDEFADSLKDSKGTVVYLTDQCYGGGMFGGAADLDSIANANGFDFYGMTSNIEGKLSWSSSALYNGYGFVGYIHRNLLDTLTEENPVHRTMNSDAEAGIDFHYVNLDQAYNADGNVYLNEWRDAITKEDSYYSWYSDYTFHYPYTYVEFTNMNAEKLSSNPIIVANWSDTKSYTNIASVGSTDNSVKANLTGAIDILASNAINFETTGNMLINQINSSNNVVKLVSGNNLTLSEGANITAVKNATLQAANEAIINGTINVFSNNNYHLLVNADDTIDPTSTMNAVQEGANITVDNLVIQPTVSIDITGNLSGSGELISHNGSAQIDIINNSNNDLTLQTINNTINTQIAVNGTPVTENINELTVTFTPEYRAINITNNTNADIITTGDIINQNNSVIITNTGGNVLNNGGAITASTFNITANNGSIGSADNYMASNGNNSTITMNALGNIYLDSIYGHNSFSLRSIAGTTSLKMHTNIPQAIAIMGPQKPLQLLPVETITPEVITNNELPADKVNVYIEPQTLIITDNAINNYESTIKADIISDIALELSKTIPNDDNTPYHKRLHWWLPLK